MEATTSTEQLWGGETTKAVDNFPVSGERVPVSVLRWLGRIKGAAAEVERRARGLDKELAERISAAGKAVGAGEHDEQFPIDVFQTGSGTSSNMNANEVIANLAGDGRPSQRPRQHGPVLQRRLPLRRPPGGARRGHPRPAAGDGRPRGRPGREGEALRRRRQGRPHPPDGRGAGDLGQEFGGYAAQVRLGVQRIEGTLRRVGQIRSRHRDRHRAQHPPRIRRPGAREARRETGLAISAPLDPFEAQGNRDALVELSGALKVYAVSLNKIANDLALMGSGHGPDSPSCGCPAAEGLPRSCRARSTR